MKRLLGPTIVIALMAVSGCASSPNCSSGSVFREGQCINHHAVEHSEAHTRRAEEVTRDEHEVEAVIKHRTTEEAANALERAGNSTSP